MESKLTDEEAENNYRQASQNGIYDDDDDIGELYSGFSRPVSEAIKRNYPGPYNVSPGVGYISNIIMTGTCV